MAPDADALQNLIRHLNEMSARQMTRWLTAPAQSGFYLSAEDMARIGQTIGVRISPFSRPAALEQLLRSAALDGRLEDALAELREEMARHLERYEQLHIPEIAGWVEQGRLTLAAWAAIEDTFSASTSAGDEPGR